MKSIRLGDKSAQQEDEETLIKTVDDMIVTARGGEVTILNNELEELVHTCFDVRSFTSIDANEQYIALAKGYSVVLIDLCETQGGSAWTKKFNTDGLINSLTMDDETMLAIANNKYVHVRDMETDKETFRLKHCDTVTCVAFHSDLIISSSANTVHIWDKSTGQLRHSLEHDGNCYNFDISPNGEFLVVAHYHGLTIWSFAEDYYLPEYEKFADVDLADVRDARFQTNYEIVAGCHDRNIWLINFCSYYPR